MKYIFLLFFLYLINQTIIAQKILGYDFKDIEAQVTNPDGVYFYPKLVAKFNNPQMTMQNQELVFLYYGFVTQPNYHPYKHKILEDSIYKFVDRQQFYRAEVLTDSLLSINPVSIFGNVEKGILAIARKDSLTAEKYFKRYAALMSLVTASGEGSNYDKAMILISPKDAEAVMFRYKLTSKGKSFNGFKDDFFDVYVVTSEDGKREFPLYFNITLPYKIGIPKLQNKR